MTIEQYYKTIESKEQFIIFLDQLYKDLKEEGEEWENNRLDLFVEAMSSYANDAKLDEKASWKTFAQILLGARVYE